MSAVLELKSAGPRHFLDIRDFSAAQLRAMLTAAARFKRGRGQEKKPLSGKTLALIFEKPSTRTRVSFEVAMRELGGDVIVLSPRDMQRRLGDALALELGFDAGAIDLDVSRVLLRIVMADLLHRGVARGLQRVGNDDAIERRMSRALTAQANLQHVV